MKTLVFAAIVVSVLGLTGCSGGTNVKAQVAGANIELAKAKAVVMTKPLVDIRVPMQNCTPTPTIDGSNSCIMTIVVRSPGGGSTNDYVPAPDDPWARVAERAVGGLITAGGIYLGGQAAASIVESATVGVVNALKVQPAPTVVTQPDPIVVNQPPPVIVPPADPIIVPPADPIIVPPVIVPPAEPIIVNPIVVDSGSGTSFGP